MAFGDKLDSKKSLIFEKWILPVLFVLILGGSLYFRVVGLFWGDYQYLHPDERFLVWVTADISSVDHVTDYFNTAISSLNPNNRGHSFYVYGDFPVIFTRYICEAFSTGISWDLITQIGRSLSALFDLGSVFLVFFIGKKLFNNKIGLLASAFSGCAVLQIQQAHYYTVDTFATFFVTLAVFIAVTIYTSELDERVFQSPGANKFRLPFPNLFLLAGLFGIVVGLAGASKINTIFVAVLLPIAYFLLWKRYPDMDPTLKMGIITRDLIFGGFLAILTFRIFQPYAFEGPGFFNIGLNPNWLSNIKEISTLASGDVDYPPALQWARRNFFFAGKNITLWGLGIPLSITLWLGMLLMGWKIVRKEWKYSIIWVWTAGYFIWQSSVENPMMRYQLPVYPLFALIAAWFVFYLIDFVSAKKWLKISLRTFGYILGTAALIAAAVWSYMFTQIYTRTTTRVEASQWIYENVPGPINLMVERETGIEQEVLSVSYDYKINSVQPYTVVFSLKEGGTVEEIVLGKVHALDSFQIGEGTLRISIYDMQGNGNLLSKGSISSDFKEIGSGKGISYRLKLDSPLELAADHTYQLVVDYDGPSSIILSGSAVAVESDWDDGLPLRLNGRDAYGGIYQGNLNFQMYWNDNQTKLNLFYSTLNQAEYIFISSNRQWGTTTRVPEKYPLTSQLYDSLMGCPSDHDIYWCYSVAKPGMFTGELGFELIKVFESYPSLGSFTINDQFAEEAFTVYDHPKVLIFKKTADYDSSKILKILSSVDLSKAQNLTPAKVPDYPADLELTDEKLAADLEGGTWSELFDRTSPINTNPIVAVLLWYFSITIFGWFLYPIARLMMPGLVDKGYSFSKLIGMLLLALIVWWAGTYNIAVSRAFILAIVSGLIGLGIFLGIIQRKEIAADFKKLKRHFLVIEIVGLLLFCFFLVIRIGNPDLWHPAKGGEKPMDFAYLNAVIKSTTFPPYDPWYSQGYINYYYYGFVIVGLWVKLLGIIPSIAYNLILPMLFSVTGLGVYGVGWNLVKSNSKADNSDENEYFSFRKILRSSAFLSGAASVLLTLIVGNLGTIRMIWQGFQKLGSPNGSIDVANLFERMKWTFTGIIEFFGGASLPFYPGDWYWVPSRALPQSPITEFPFFTFLYADLHAHMLSLPITILTLGWALSVISSRWKFKGVISASLQKFFIVFLGAMAIGALRPTNTWDFPTYLIFALVIIAYTIWRSTRADAENPTGLPKYFELVVVSIGLLVLSFILYKPFSDWYAQAYTAIDLWKSDKSPFWSYFTHWGFFLVIILSWFSAETIQWMATTPLSSLRRLMKFRSFFWLFFICVFVFTVLLLLLKVQIAWIVILMLVWAFLLILRSDQSDSERFVLFLTGTGLALTLFVELFVLRGDIGRMNTVFKFYLQAWVMLAISAGFGVIWLYDHFKTRRETPLTRFWILGIVVLFSCVAMYPIVASLEKVDDRIDHDTPVSLDGMEYMKYATYYDEGANLDLSEDYGGIQWMQDHVKGSPVIVEGNTVEYRWGSRYSVYTGLPSVIGWNWHQRQQRAALPSEWVTDRVNDVSNFYLTESRDEAQTFLDEYNVKYIIVGQLETALYPGNGLQKFKDLDQILWKEVYKDGFTVIYEVLDESN
jgi:YYY domain-containing protein